MMSESTKSASLEHVTIINSRYVAILRSDNYYLIEGLGIASSGILGVKYSNQIRFRFRVDLIELIQNHTFLRFDLSAVFPVTVESA